MNTGGLACGIIGSIAKSMDERVKTMEYEICHKLTGKTTDQECISLIKKLIALGLVERYKTRYYIRLSDMGKQLASAIEGGEMQKYFIVAITIYCNQEKLTSNEFGELLSKTDSFGNKNEVEKIIENFRKIFATEESYVKIGKDWKKTIRIKSCVFSIFIMEETKQYITSV